MAVIQEEVAMKVKVNNDEKNFDNEALSVLELLKECNVEMPEMVSVQLNGEFVDKEDYEKTNVKDNDEVDFLYFMGGGSL